MQKKRLLPLVVASICASPLMADNFNARIAGMGGAGVASSSYDTASSTNPALLSVFNESDDIAFIIPTVGIEVSDKDNVIDAVDDLPDLYDDLEYAIDGGDQSQANLLKGSIVDTLKEVDGKHLRVIGGAGFSITIPSDTVTVALAATGKTEIGLVMMYDEDDELLIDTAIQAGDSGLLDDVESYGVAIGAVVQEVTVSLGKEFKAGKYRYSLGVTPKYQTVETILYQANASNIDLDDIDSDEYIEEDSNFGLDIGGALFLNENVTLGLMIKDVISNEYKTNSSFNIADTYKIDPLVTVGVSYKTDLFTAALDLDLTESEGFKSIDNSQMARVGFEFNAWGWAQIRAGYRHDMKDTRDDVASLGLAFSPFSAVHLGITGMVGENETYGGSVELKFTF